MSQTDTIVALSSGTLPSGVAIVRVSGSKALFILEELAGVTKRANYFTLKNIFFKGKLLDKALVVYFEAPNSFTGENICEFHLHGSVALVRAVLNAITSYDGVRLAKSGEFTNRAFVNGKLDLLEVQGISDLIAAETETQRIQALARMSGGLSELIENWREELLFLRGLIEAQLDFSDESDVDEILPAEFLIKLEQLIKSFAEMLEGANQGRIIRQGFRIAIAGLPNAGKSSLINRLARSDLAIVSAEAGTTRDIREVPMDIDGQLVIFVDMAGLRETSSDAEAQGVERAKTEITNADLVLWLSAANQLPVNTDFSQQITTKAPIIHVGSKSDIANISDFVDISISSEKNFGIDNLISIIKKQMQKNICDSNIILLSRSRDIEAISTSLELLKEAKLNIANLEISAEYLRLCSESLARLLGLIEPEQVLGQIFSKFCIGK